MTHKPTYLDLLTRRAEAKQRPVRRVPLCLDPERMTVLNEAREHLTAAITANQTSTQRRKMNDTDPVAEAREAVDAAAAAVKEASIRFVFQGRTTAEVAAVIATAPEGAEADVLNRLLILDALVHVEDLDGEVIPEITADKIAELLPTLTSGEMNVLMQARNLASAGPDFPM